MSRVKCPHCGRDMQATASICGKCRRTLEVALANIKAHHADLVTLRTGLVRYGSRGGRRSGQRLGMNPLFAPTGRGTEVEAATVAAVEKWANYLRERAKEPTRRLKSRDVPKQLDYLLRMVDELRVSNRGPECLDDMLAIEAALAKLVDRPSDRWYAGICSAELEVPHDGSTCSCACHNGPSYPCDVDGGCGHEWRGPECQQHLYADVEQGTIKCPACGMQHDVQSRRDILLAAAENYEAPASVIARAVTSLSDDYTGDAGQLGHRIRKWAERGRIFPLRHEVIDGKRRPLYRIGAVLDLLAEDAEQSTRKREKRTA